MKRRLIPIVGLVMLAAASSGNLRSEALKVSAIRFWSYDETTRIAVDVSGEFQYHSERLHNPERVFFDIRNAKPALKKCLDLSVKYQYFDEFSRACEVWLAKNYGAEYHLIDEFRGSPTRVRSHGS